MYKRFFSIVLVCVLVLGMLPMGASAETVGIIDSGTCGPNLTWTLDEEYTLTISGTGLMDDYNYTYPYQVYPGWAGYRGQVRKLVIEEGVASIGNCAFSGFTGIPTIDIPSSVARIGTSAFSDCDSVRTVVIPDGVTYLGGSVLDGCDLLNSVTVTGDIYALDMGNFNHCATLKSVVISEGTESLTGMMAECPSLRSITLPYSIRTIGWNSLTTHQIGRNIADVYYSGTEEERAANINFESDVYGVTSTAILNATWHYHEHTGSDETVTPPSCTEDGYTTATCTSCGRTYTYDRIPATHDWEEATCTEPKTCSACGATEGEANGHTEVVDPAVPATCTEDGLTEGKHCSVCNEVLIAQETVPATGHNWSNGVCTDCEEEQPEPAPSEPTETTIVNAWTADVVLAAADLMVSAPDATLRATFTFRDDGTATTTWEAIDLTALKLYFHQMFVNAYYACGYGAGFTTFEAIEDACIAQNGMGVSEYMRNFINQYDFEAIFTPADTSGTYRISGDKLYTDMAIMAVSSDNTIGNVFTVEGDTLKLNAASYGMPDFTFVCTLK